MTRVSPLRWRAGLELLDQRRLPDRTVWVEIAGAAAARRAIRSLVVRGAPAIGLAAAYALAAEARRNDDVRHLRRVARVLAAARPTAANLAAAVHRVLAACEASPAGERGAAALAAARALHEADAAACEAIAAHGAALFPNPVALLTHCNAGALATGGVGTALGVVRALHAQGRLVHVYACEARPVLQGARLTAWELLEDGIPVTVLADSAAATLLARGMVQGVVVGADRIAADGAVANKVGTYPLAVLAARHGVPLVVAAPTTTFDLECPSGAAIPIEERGGEEVRRFRRCRSCPGAAGVFNPAFDVTPPELIYAIVSERGVASPVSAAAVRQVA